MGSLNPYQVLGISPEATRKQVDAAYRALAKQYHPDINKDTRAEDQMKRINEAYDMILKGYTPYAPPPQYATVVEYGYRFTYSRTTKSGTCPFCDY